MKKVLTLLLCACFAALSFAATATVNGIEWQYTVSNGKAKIYDSRNDNGYTYPAIPSSTSGAITIPSTLGGCSVTTIGSYAFYYCRSLTSMTIPEGVTSIGDQAFYGCSGLTSMTIPEGETAIGERAFYDCSSLTSVIFKCVPPTVGWNAFYDVGSGCKGYYLFTYASAWEAVISNGTWNGLTMEILTFAVMNRLLTQENMLRVQKSL